jgi:hypothetical protein
VAPVGVLVSAGPKNQRRVPGLDSPPAGAADGIGARFGLAPVLAVDDGQRVRQSCRALSSAHGSLVRLHHRFLGNRQDGAPSILVGAGDPFRPTRLKPAFNNQPALEIHVAEVAALVVLEKLQ